MVARARLKTKVLQPQKRSKTENLPLAAQNCPPSMLAGARTHFTFVGAARTGLTNLHQIALTAPRQFRGCKWATRERAESAACALAPRNCFANGKMPLEGKLQLGAFIFNITNVEWKLLGRVLLRNMLLAGKAVKVSPFPLFVTNIGEILFQKLVAQPFRIFHCLSLRENSSF
jgi:hypothetical protein